VLEWRGNNIDAQVFFPVGCVNRKSRQPTHGKQPQTNIQIKYILLSILPWLPLVGLPCTLPQLYCSGMELAGHSMAKDKFRPLRVLMDVEQVLCSVTDVTIAVPKPSFPSISNGQVSVYTVLECNLRTSDRQSTAKPFNGRRTSCHSAERFRKHDNFLSKREDGGWHWLLKTVIWAPLPVFSW
jgi:hypothetical protein